MSSGDNCILYFPFSIRTISGVQVTDMGVPQLTNSTLVLINVRPVNEFSPQITNGPSANVTVKENKGTGAGGVLFDVDARDHDFGPQGNQEARCLL